MKTLLESLAHIDQSDADIIEERFDDPEPNEHRGTDVLDQDLASQVISLFQDLLSTLGREYSDDANMQGITYHYEETLSNYINDDAGTE